MLDNPYHTHSILQKSSDIPYSTNLLIMEDHWYQDYSWEQGLVEWDADVEPLDGGHVINEPIEPDITGFEWSHKLFLKYV